MRNEEEPWGSLMPLMLRRIRPERNERRFYSMTIVVDLFGDIVLVRNWGRIGTGGRQRSDFHLDVGTAGQSLDRLCRQKRRRGYCD